MIDYDLAKELKDAGFPQKYVRGQMEYDPNVEADEDGILPEGTEEVFHPTLSELIEACGDAIDAIFSPFSSMSEHEGHQLYEGWRVDSTNDSLGIAVTGKTPEEAVAYLYLALNKK